MIEKAKENNKAIEPVYKLEFKDNEKELPPVKRTISKTSQVTETFTYFDVLSYLSKMNKSIKDKEAELEGLREMSKAYQKEVDLIEKKLSLNAFEKRFQLEEFNKIKNEESKDEKKA